MKMKRFRLIKVNIKLILINRGDEEGQNERLKVRVTDKEIQKLKIIIPKIQSSLEQYLLMKINLIQTVLIASLIIIGSCLHLQEQPRIYEPQKYLSELQVTQDKVKADLLQIQAQFKQLDQSLKNAADDPNEKLRLYEESIADERDSLYQIQQYLNLPYNERSCKCFQFSDSMRKNLTDKLAKVEQSLTDVQSKASNCKDCALNTEISKEIQQQKAYLQIMEDTVQAKCCKIYKFIYVDNLNSSNWMYGNFTPQKYQTWMDDKVKKLQTNTTLVRSCPLFAPYVSDNLDNCSQCKTESQIFNLSSRKCESCPSEKIFNFQTHKCDYNITCPSGSKFNQDTVSCEKIQPAFNHSFCPPSAPIWNAELLGCFKCSSDTPYYDQSTGKCTTCPDEYTYNSNINQCVHRNCQPGQIYNQTSKTCQTSAEKPDQSTNSLCPADKPFWDKSSLSCSRCPIDHPFFNSTSKNCQACPSNSTYDPTRNLCVVQCGQGLQLNPLTLKCQQIPTPTQPNDTIISICPPNKPNWNSQSKQCSPCPQDVPYWNRQTGKCQKCQIGQTLNTTTNVCEGTYVQPQCPSGTQYNNITKQCTSIGGVITNCPDDKPFYNTVTMSCTSCPKDRPNYNSSTNECVSSGSSTPIIVPGTVPQPSSNTTDTPQGQILFQMCPNGTIYDNSTQKCLSVSSNSTNSTNTIVQCPPNTVWDPVKQTCADISQPGTTPAVNTTCSYNQEWNSTLNQCVKCLPNQRFNNNTKTCETVCKVGQVYNINIMGCSGTTSACPVGLVFNASNLRCQCKQGLNYKYNSDKNICQLFCKSNQVYNTIDGKCQPIS